ncbi:MULTISPECIES: hypothetical protein [unclassified Nodularia (in: cyanobacteria)]|uniref:hypothetical protein n=1 Tax=unclassified Nodularia (in: cyanobacteria) TaxID=2656917 RepID=UPI0018807547|nr:MULTISPECIES: hypothetical protein [unclassified Nodularia (in: cyanobacteria)]MBE9199089.1 hypothetical protein [Nodularia sp. LEGE 06071]MCC2695776.1 hypothetical protein [Nodularia sp. LEGE 04288]
MINAKYPVTPFKPIKLSLSLSPPSIPIFPSYDVYTDGCTMVVAKYYKSPVNPGEKFYTDSPFIIQNPSCPPPQPPPIPPPSGNPNAPPPDLKCEGDILIIRIPILNHQYVESFPLTFSSREFKTTGTLQSVKYPLYDNNGDTYGLISINWSIQGWTTQETLPWSNIWKKVQFSDSQSITYKITKSTLGSYDEGDYIAQRLATGSNTRQWRVVTRGIGETFTAYIGDFAKLFYDGDFNNPSSLNPFTGATTTGFFDSGDPQYIYSSNNTDSTIAFTVFGFFTQCYGTSVDYGDPYDPPPPPKPPMTCCPQNDQLLKLILQRIGTLPVSVPDSLVSTNPSPVQVKSLTEFLSWHGKQTDALAGQFPIEIEVEDSDFTDTGNQKLVMSLPNIAETLAEVVGLLVVLKRESEVTLQASLKGMIEAGAAKQAAQVAVDIGLANAEFLGYRLDKKKKTITLTFNPDEADFAKLLMDKEINYYSYENVDKKDIKDYLMPILQMVQRWNAQNFVKLAKNGVQAAAQIKKLLTDPEKLSEELDKNTDKDFKDWAEEVEDGYTGLPQTPSGDKGKPYGKDKDERPKVRKLGDF